MPFAAGHVFRLALRGDERSLKGVKHQAGDVMRAGGRISRKPRGGEQMPSKRRQFPLSNPIETSFIYFCMQDYCHQDLYFGQFSALECRNWPVSPNLEIYLFWRKCGN
jgi:hypothetical protein